MEVSLLHRLSGAWLGFQMAIAEYLELSAAKTLALNLWQELLVSGEWQLATADPRSRHWLADPLENALALLPVLLFYHEDPDYLGDRLEQCGLSPEQLAVGRDIGRCLSDCLREKVTLATFSVWLERRSPYYAAETALLKSIYSANRSWRCYQKQLSMTTLTPAAQQLLRLYGALLWSGGNALHCQTLLQGREPAVQAWGQVLLGGLRGDRRSHQRSKIALERHELMADVIAFWSRWSGLPSANQLELEQLPVIANSQILKSRPSLQLVSQRHLT